MHELAVTQNILDIASQHAIRAGANKVTTINVTIGELSSIINDSINFYWDILGKDSICEGSNLVFKRIPAEFECQECLHRYNLSGELSPCPQCGSAKIKVTQGEEFFLESIEIT
jgi:hydrogenase nickel incorporation protein HypA/HybF